MSVTFLTACGDEEPSGPPDEGDAAEIAALLNEMEDAWVARDAAGVCATLTERGEGLVTRMGGRLSGPEPRSCEDTVAAILERTPDPWLERRYGARSFSARDIDVENSDGGSYYGSTDAADPQGEPRLVQVECSDAGSVYYVERGDGGWRLQIPFCTGR